jgi:hypothetical protein
MAANTRSKVVLQVVSDCASETCSVEEESQSSLYGHGYPIHWFLADVNELDGLKCDVCHNVMKDPRQCKSGHDFCASCLKDRVNCPGYGCHNKVVSFGKSSIILVNLIMDLSVKCACNGERCK